MHFSALQCTYLYKRWSELMKLNNISWPQKNICDLQRKKLTGTDIMTAMGNRIKPTSHHQKQITNPNKTCKEQDKQRIHLTTWTLKTDTRKNAGEGGGRWGETWRRVTGKLHTLITLQHRPGKENHWFTPKWDNLKAPICSAASSSLTLCPNLRHTWSSQRENHSTLNLCKSTDTSANI